MSQFLKMNNSITPINLAELNNSLYYLSNENSEKLLKREQEMIRNLHNYENIITENENFQ